MSTKRPARIGNPDLRQQKHIPTPPIEQIEKQLFSLLSPTSFKRDFLNFLGLMDSLQPTSFL
ncbi:hypothetical protein FM036_27335 [Nostoc sp. HG1]|nr:hypothetical protein [Nostoc sp. HG1]